MLFVDGHLLPEDSVHVSALDRGFTLGDGVFETIRVHRGRAFRLDRHLARLRRSAAAIHLEIGMPDLRLAAALQAVVQASRLTEAAARITVSRGVAAQRGLLPVTGAPTVVIHAVPFAALAPSKYQDGLCAVTSRIRRNQSSPLAYIKSCNYLDNVLARLEAATAGADEAVLLNTDGHLACASAANLFWVREGTLFTSALSCGVLAGITRQLVLEATASQGVSAREVEASPDDLGRSEESFLTNALIGVVPLTRLDGRPLGEGKPGPVTARVAEAYRAALERECT